MTGTDIDGLVTAAKLLSSAQKERLVQELLRDPETMEAMGNVFIDRLFGSGRGSKPLMATNVRTRNPAQAGITSQEKARRLRSAYVAGLRTRGVPVEQVGNAWARAASGAWIALPLATEQRKDHFLLGISEEGFRKKAPTGCMAFILLCETAAGDLLDFILPPDLVRNLAARFSRSHGQLKLNLKRVDDSYYLVIPGEPAVNVTVFQGARAPLMATGGEVPAAKTSRAKGQSP